MKLPILILFILIAAVAIYLFISRQQPPMTTVAYERCDNDRDGDCDKVDFELVSKAVGRCEDGGN